MCIRVFAFAAVQFTAIASAICAQQAGPAEQNPAAVAPLQPLAEPGRAAADDARVIRTDAEVTDLASFLQWARTEQGQKVQSLYKRREAIRAEKGNSRFKRERIEKTNDEIMRVNTPSQPFVPQVASNKVITLDNLSPTQYIEVLQIVDDKTAHVRYIERWEGGTQLEFYLTGLDTAGWVDNQKLPLKGVLIADGARSFNTTTGAKRTIATMKNHAVPKNELTRRDDVRTWTNDSGKMFSGALVLYDAGKVTIMDMDGKVLNLKLTELSPADREYVDQHAPTPAPRKSSKGVAIPPAVPAAAGANGTPDIK